VIFRRDLGVINLIIFVFSFYNYNFAPMALFLFSVILLTIISHLRCFFLYH